MKRFEVSFRPLAEADVFDLYRYVAREAGPKVAQAYIDRIEAACLSLESFLNVGHAATTFAPACALLALNGASRLPSK
jgi:toxin ParE1/3/4